MSATITRFPHKQPQPPQQGPPQADHLEYTIGLMCRLHPIRPNATAALLLLVEDYLCDLDPTWPGYAGWHARRKASEEDR